MKIQSSGARQIGLRNWAIRSQVAAVVVPLAPCALPASEHNMRILWKSANVAAEDTIGDAPQKLPVVSGAANAVPSQ